LGKIRIEFKANTKTGKRDILIHYESDETLTYREHRERHWKIVDELLALNFIKKEEMGEVIIRSAEGETVLKPEGEETLSPEAITEKD